MADAPNQIRYASGSIFDSRMQTLVNPVNTVGAMGKGLAKQFAARYREMEREYKEACATGQLNAGDLLLYSGPDHLILSFPTKIHWRSKSSLPLIENGLQRLVKTWSSSGIRSIAFPQLGCGLGGLDWETQVQPLMVNYLSSLPIPVEIYV